MLYRHASDLIITAADLIGKQRFHEIIRVFPVNQRFIQECAVQKSQVPADPARLELLQHKPLHGRTVAVVRMGIRLSIPDHICVHRRLLFMIQRIIIGKIHADNLRQRLPAPGRHGLNVIFVKPCKPNVLLHSPLKPRETGRSRLVAFDQKAADRHQKALGWINLIGLLQNPVKKSLVISGSACQLRDLHHQLRPYQLLPAHKGKGMDFKLIQPF